MRCSFCRFFIFQLSSIGPKLSIVRCWSLWCDNNNDPSMVLCMWQRRETFFSYLNWQALLSFMGSCPILKFVPSILNGFSRWVHVFHWLTEVKGSSYWIVFQCLSFELMEEWGEPISFRLLSLFIFVIFLIRLGTLPCFKPLGYQSVRSGRTLFILGSVFLFTLRRDK